MRISTAYFAGVGTVVAAVVVGLGGGLLISNVVSPHGQRTELSRLELRMSQRPILATNASSEPVKTETPAQAKPVEAPPAAERVIPIAPPAPAAAQVTPANSEPEKSREMAFAKAGDADLRPREVDARREARRIAEERRRAERRQQSIERRQQWAERRRPRQDQELRDVEARIREETEPRQAVSAEPARLEMMPRIMMFGDN